MISSYVNEFSAKYAPDYKNGLSNHLPMAQVALFQLTNDMDSVHLWTDYYINHTDLELTGTSDLLVTYIDQYLGQIEAYPAYVNFFEAWVAKSGIEVVLVEALNKLSKGLVARAFHAWIRLAYGVDSHNYDEVIKGLAYLASSYLPVPEASRKVALKELETVLDQVAKNQYFAGKPLAEGLFTDVLGAIMEDSEFDALNFQVKGDPIDLFERMVDYAVEDYLHTGSFLELHTITALHAIAVLEPYIEDLSQVMAIYMTAYIASLLTIKDREQDGQPDSYKLETWEDAFSYVLSSSDAHSIKLTYASYQLYRFTENDQLLKVVGLRLTQDQTLHA